MRILTTKQMMLLEKIAFEHGFSQDMLMRNSGVAAALFIGKKLDLKGKNCVVLCGPGNNGGCGYKLATKLYCDYIETSVLAVKGEIKNEHVIEAKQAAQKKGVKILTTDDIEYTSRLIKEADVLIDAIWGIGFNGLMNDELQALNILWKNSNATKFALDVPTGVMADSGIVDKFCFESDYTISLDSLKPAHVLVNSKEYCGSVAIVDIGIPEDIHNKVEITHFLTDEDMVFKNIKPRYFGSNKGDYGKLLNISGAKHMVGAATLSTLGALRVGAGVTTLASVKDVIQSVSSVVLESRFLPLAETQQGTISMYAMSKILAALKEADGCLIGCGLGLNNETITIVHKIIKEAECPVVIDADGINAIAKNVNILKEKKSKIILTPHVAEMARLLNVSISEVANFRYQVISDFAKEYNVTVVLKDYNTIIIDETGNVYINIYGNPGLSKGGSGDILAGMVAGLVVQGVNNPAVCGVYLHSKAADSCAARKSQYGMLPSDIFEDLCDIFVKNKR